MGTLGTSLKLRSAAKTMVITSRSSFSSLSVLSQGRGREQISDSATVSRPGPPDVSRRRNVSLKPSVIPDADPYSCNIEMRDLGRRGRVKEARKLFDEMPQRDIVSYATMLTVYLKNNDLQNAENVFSSLPERNTVVESAMIDGYVKAGRVNKARQMFDYMRQKNVYSWTSLISGYFKIGNVDEARHLFDAMPTKNIVSWTTVVVGYARNDLMDQARKIFDCIPAKNVVSWTAMIKLYIEHNRIDQALELFHVMPRRNLFSWNIMISGCLNASRVDKAIQLFNSMPQRNAVSWTTMVTGLAGNQMIDHARRYFDQMPDKDIAAWNAILTAYIDEGNMTEASSIYSMMPLKNIVSWNTMIDGYARYGPDGEAFMQLISVIRLGFRPNETTIASVLTSCRSMLEVMQVHGLVILLGFEHDISLVNSLVTMYSRSGDFTAARLAFEHIEVKNLVSWTAMILACSNHGFGYDALTVFAQMLKAGEKPDEIIFVGVLSACSHAGLVKKGQSLFDSMAFLYHLNPRAEHYSCLVDMLGRAGKIDKAMRVVNEMPSSEHDAVVWGALLGACKLHGDVRVATEVGVKLLELEPNSSSGYVLLANSYAASGNWDAFAHVRKLMKNRDVRKSPGFSQIEVNGKTHVFFVRDRSHPQLEEIHKMLLQQLLPRMQEMGYGKDSSSALV